MAKVKIKLITLGQLPVSLNKSKLSNWKSDLFEITGAIDSLTLTNNSDGPSWEFLDENIESQLPYDYEGDYLIAMTHVPLEGNYYARRFSNNRICMTFYQMADILSLSNIPIENLVYRIMYAYTLGYKRFGNSIPSYGQFRGFTHDETRGCLFDMNGIKSDVVYSVNQPQICPTCIEDLKSDRIAVNELNNVQKELQRIKKSRYYRIAEKIKQYPVLAIVVSVLTALLIGIIGSVVGSVLLENLIK